MAARKQTFAKLPPVISRSLNPAILWQSSESLLGTGPIVFDQGAKKPAI